MSNGLWDDDDDLIIDNQTVEPEVDPQNNKEPVIDDNQNDPTEDITDPIYLFLKDKGIDDPTQIQFENDDGEIETYNFSELDDESKLNILRDLTELDYTEDEVKTINYLRNRNITVNDLINEQREKAIKEYLEQNPDAEIKKHYSIDDFSDDEIYFAELKDKYPSLTEEELVHELELAKSNEELFEKKVKVIRENYINNEKAEQEEQIRSQERAYIELQNNIKLAADKFNEISLDYTDKNSDSLVIEDSDKEEMINYLFRRDENGQTKFMKDTEDPDMLIKLAWYMTKGDQAISGVSRYWKDVMKSDRKLDKNSERNSNKQTKSNTWIKQDDGTKQVVTAASLWDD